MNIRISIERMSRGAYIFLGRFELVIEPTAHRPDTGLFEVWTEPEARQQAAATIALICLFSAGWRSSVS